MVRLYFIIIKKYIEILVSYIMVLFIFYDGVLI